ncbi:GGDEF domain-containing protein [Marinomonas sp. BSi20584]|uniref:GGDEF domain-containing protein n=1 Tax=Marinomonas sp. BSi20584 TaxID=1594462 RepID=UPI000C1DDE21|nr:diguanylate cyclase [Marinomonas sp. BSi20584]PJE55924.1 diguanylate cyclase [Marinomonas sp. BSi20584]|tara:strand:- start:762 stop:1724 length:963 start_codon:yes stop_codon:yes gene_type:complete
MSSSAEDMMELHWLFDMLQHIDVGLVVLNDKYEIKLWNSFMENHSGVSSSIAKEQSLLRVFPGINSNWLEQKLDNVIALRTSIFISWEQRPHLFPFKSYRPITGMADKMYQNVALRPITNADGTVKFVCMVVYDVTDVATNKESLSNANQKLDFLSKMDPLTHLFNRGSVDKKLNSVFDMFLSGAGSHSLVMTDIDFFKKVNDQYGHPAGDLVLQAVSKVLGSSIRKTDFVGRYGGEEFVILLPNTDAAGALFFCESVRKKIADLKIKTANHEISVTMSFGISEASRSDKVPCDWLGRSDEALYKAKENGRNQSVVYSKE